MSVILDKQLMLSNAQAITVTAVSTNTIDLTVARDLGPTDLELYIDVVTPFVGGTSLQAAFVTSANADLSSANVIAQSAAIPLANLVAGTELLRIEVPGISLDAQMQRYIGIAYTVVGTMTGGAVTAGIVLDRQNNRAYASGLNVGGF